MELNEVLEKVNNNQLDTMSPAELKEAYGILREHPEHAAQAMVVADAMVGYGQAQDKNNEKSQEVDAVNEEQMTKKTIELNKYSEQYQLDEESNKALSNLRVVDDEGKSVDVKSDVVEAAKLSAAVSVFSSDKPLSPEAYKQAVHDEVAKILGSIIIAKNTQDTEHQPQSNANKAGQELQNLYSGKPVKVDGLSYVAGMSTSIEETKAKNEGFVAKFKNSSFFKGIKERLNNLDTKLHNQFGKKYDNTKEVIENLVRQGTMTEVLVGGLVTGAAVATAGTAMGVAASIGTVAYSAWIGARRVSPVINKYKQEKQKYASDNQPYGFSDFMKTHKKEVYKAALYTGIALAGMTAGVASAAMSATNSAASGLQAVAETAGTARMVGMGAAAITPQAADIFTAKDGEERKQAIKRTALAAGLFGVTAAAGAFLHNDAQASEGTELGGGDVNGGDINGGDVNGGDVNGGDVNGGDVNGGDINGGDVNGGDVNGGDAATEVEPITVGSREQAIYERNLKLVPKSEFMVNNIKDGYVDLPEGMTPEMAVNLARVEYLYYGDRTGLQALLDCDEITINTEEYFRGLTDKFVTQVGDPRGLVGYPTDPNYVADPNIHARIDDVDCSGVKISRTITGVRPVVSPVPTVVPEEPVVQTIPMPEFMPEPVKIEIPDVEPINNMPTPDPIVSPDPVPNNNMPKVHVHDNAELNDIVNKNGVKLDEGVPVEGSVSEGDHYQHNADMTNRNAAAASATLNSDGKFVDAEGKLVNTTVKGNSLAEIMVKLSNANVK